MVQVITPLAVKTEISVSMTSEDNFGLKQIMATHAPDGRQIDIKPILRIVEDILNSATTTTADVKVREALEGQSNLAVVTTMLETRSYIINRLSCEILCKCTGGVDGHSTSVSLFNLLSSYSWDAKLVLTLAAFALNYGKFWLLAQIYATNGLAGRVAILKQLRVVLDHGAGLEPRFEAIYKLIQSILDLSRCIVRFTELPSNYISQDNSAYSAAVASFPIAIYWIFRSVIACASNITYLRDMGREYTISATEVWELSSLTHKTNKMNEHLQKQLAICHQNIEEKRQNDACKALLTLLETPHLDNMEVLKALIYPKDDLLPLFDGATKKRVNLDVLGSKTVLLLISGLDISHEELHILEQIYTETRQYEVVWIPVTARSTTWTESTQKQFEMLQDLMPWYSVHHPAGLFDGGVIRFIKENLHFNGKAMLVVLDPEGNIVCPNALHMMWIWRSNAFPFTRSREEALWKEETLSLELLIDGIDATVLNWIKDGKHIVLYGSDDIDWIRKFTSAARAVAQEARLPLEMVCVWKSTFKREQIQKAIQVIDVEKLSHVFQDLNGVWFFWTRLESMLLSKIELRSDDEKDPILHEIKKLLSYDKTGPWALFSKGSEVILTGYGITALTALQEYDKWKKDSEARGFGSAFKDHYEKLHQVDHPCCQFEFDTTVGRTLESITCPECRRSMDKFVTFSCCHDHYGDDDDI